MEERGRERGEKEVVVVVVVVVVAMVVVAVVVVAVVVVRRVVVVVVVVVVTVVAVAHVPQEVGVAITSVIMVIEVAVVGAVSWRLTSPWLRGLRVDLVPRIPSVAAWSSHAGRRTSPCPRRRRCSTDLRPPRMWD